MKSAYKDPLKEDYIFEFSTPTVTVVRSHPTPTGLYSLSPIMFLAFNQVVDTDEVLKNISFHMKKKQYSTAKPAKISEISEDKTVKQLTTQYSEGFWIAFVSSKAFPPSSSITLKLGAVVRIVLASNFL